MIVIAMVGQTHGLTFQSNVQQAGDTNGGKELGPQLAERSGASPCSSNRPGL